MFLSKIAFMYTICESTSVLLIVKSKKLMFNKSCLLKPRNKWTCEEASHHVPQAACFLFLKSVKCNHFSYFLFYMYL